MSSLRYLTSGESHGKGLMAIIEGFPAGLKVNIPFINAQLALRQSGFGRGQRMAIEKDEVEFISGLRHGYTMGSPIGLLIMNKDWVNWQEVMDPVNPSKEPEPRVTKPRPGHADLAGLLKYGHANIRDVLERASARETAARVAVGALAQLLLKEFPMDVFSHLIEIGGIRANLDSLSPSERRRAALLSPMRCADEKAQKRWVSKIKQAQRKGDSLGGTFEVVVVNPPPGLGSYAHWDKKLDANLAFALMSIPAVKGVEIGLGFGFSSIMGSQAHDEIFFGSNSQGQTGKKPGFYRLTNNAGGIEGGVSNGEDIILRAVMKPIATLKSPLRSVDVSTKEPCLAFHERADTCAVLACGIVGEAVVAFEIAKAMTEKFGSDSLMEMKRNYSGFIKQVQRT